MRKIRLPGRDLCLGVAALTLASGLTGSVCAQTPAEPAMALAAAAPAVTKIFPLADVHKGLHGVAYTVFEGVNPEPMPLVILGVLKDAIGPGQDMILGRLEGAKAEYTGVVAGMSGSPVYIDGKLVGALSYRIGQFSKEPICGITPIEAMFAVRDRAPDRREIARAALDAPGAANGLRQSPMVRLCEELVWAMGWRCVRLIRRWSSAGSASRRWKYSAIVSGRWG